jgi:L-ascorbate metabolism protein UlaG (beta-lactamase superfamily)
MLAAVTGTADHVRRNRAAWDRLAAEYASVFDLRRLVEALGPKRVVPIHSDAGDRFCEFFPRVERRADGDWWQVGSK